MRQLVDYAAQTLGLSLDPNRSPFNTSHIPQHDAALPLNAEHSKVMSTAQIVSRFSSLVFSQENIPNITRAAILTGLGTGLNFLSPYILGETIHALTSGEEKATIAGVELSPFALIMLLVTTHALSRLAPNIRDQVMIPVTSNNTKKVIMLSCEHLLKKSLDYHTNTPFSDHMYFIQKGLAVGAIGTPLLTKIAPTLVEITIACFLLSTRYGMEIGVGIALLLSLYVVYGAFNAHLLIKAREDMLNAENEAQENFSTMIAQYKIMRDFGQLDNTLKGGAHSLEKMLKAESYLMATPLKIDLGHIGLSYLGMMTAFLYVGLNVKSGKYSAQEFVVLVGYLTQLTTLLSAFGQATNKLFASYTDLHFVFNKLAEPHDVMDLYPETPLLLNEGIAPFIEFDEVSFHHPIKAGEFEPKYLFHNLSFKIPAGQTVAFVSESGAGKTTIFNLLYGYYQPTSGTIKINGQDISRVSLYSLQENIALFGQNPNLFNATIRENICYGSKNPEEVTDEMIWSHATSAKLHQFLESLPEQLDTDVGEEGKALSGGQQQKVAILRGLLKKAPIRLLDEITAPFDSQSASHMLESMQETSEGITTLMVTHKLTEAQSVDQIIVLDKGRVMAQGQHHDLLKTCPLYQKLWNAYTTQDDASSVAPLAESVVPHVPHMSIAQRTPYRQSELGFFSEPEKTCQVSNIEASHLKMN